MAILRSALLFLALSVFGFTAELSEIEYTRICAGAIATIFPQPIETIKVVKKEGPVVFLSYVRKSDGTEWKTRCRINGSRVVWSMLDGRWRVLPEDEKITFTVNRQNGTFTITNDDGAGSKTQETFSIE